MRTFTTWVQGVRGAVDEKGSAGKERKQGVVLQRHVLPDIRKSREEVERQVGSRQT